MFEPPHPRFTSRLYGHARAVQEFTQAAHSGKFHHAWILAGDEGLGKSTFAYLAASYLLAGKTDFYGKPLSQIAGQAHSNLCVIERPSERTATGLFKTIPVENIRKIHPFFGTTAGQDGQRICIIDAVEDLNLAGLNALLKMLEEPPTGALFFLVSHAPYKLLPTIRSRARFLHFKSHENKTLKSILESLDLASEAIDLDAAKGNVKEALTLMDADSAQVRQLFSHFLKAKKFNSKAMQLAEIIAGKDANLIQLFSLEVKSALHGLAMAAAEAQDFTRAALYDRLLIKINAEIEKTQTLNLDRKACVLMILNWLLNDTP